MGKFVENNRDYKYDLSVTGLGVLRLGGIWGGWGDCVGLEALRWLGRGLLIGLELSAGWLGGAPIRRRAWTSVHASESCREDRWPLERRLVCGGGLLAGAQRVVFCQPLGAVGFGYEVAEGDVEELVGPACLSQE